MDRYELIFRLEILKELVASISAQYVLYMQKYSELSDELNDVISRYERLVEINDRLLVDYNTIEETDTLEHELLQLRDYIKAKGDVNLVLV